MLNFFDWVFANSPPFNGKEFLEKLKTLPVDTHVWYTVTGNDYHLVQLWRFLEDGFPRNALTIRQRNSLNIMPTSFDSPYCFVIHTTAENVCFFSLNYVRRTP